METWLSDKYILGDRVSPLLIGPNIFTQVQTESLSNFNCSQLAADLLFSYLNSIWRVRKKGSIQIVALLEIHCLQ